MRWLFWCPTAEDWLITAQVHRDQLLDTRPQMQMLLDEMREDIDIQFDENQGKWTPLRPYTVNKKEAMNADPRILHETREGAGLRLRDAYAKAGYVDGDGVLIYDYPTEKPYAREHQEGVAPEKSERTRRQRRDPNQTARGRAMEKSIFDKWDTEFEDRFS